MNELQQTQIEQLLPYLTNKKPHIEEVHLELLDYLVRTIFNVRPVLSCAPCKMNYLEQLAEYYNKRKPIEAPAAIIPESKKPCTTCKDKTKIKNFKQS